MKPETILLLTALAGGLVAWRTSALSRLVTPVAYPEGYRDWAHVKRTLTGPARRNFATNGGSHPIYA